MPSGARLINDNTVIRTLRFGAKAAQAEFGRALFEELDTVETPECRRRTPIDTGALVSTIRTFGPIYRGTLIEAGTTAGGDAAPYAWFVHEDLEAYHRVGQAKYIESTYREAAPFLTQRVGRRIILRRILRG